MSEGAKSKRGHRLLASVNLHGMIGFLAVVRRTTMRHYLLIAFVLGVAGQVLAVDDAAGTRRLKVQYIGNTDTDRGRSYAKFLSDTFDLAGAVDRKTFDPNLPAAVDVVVLDWSQSDIDHTVNPASQRSGPESDVKSPLGERSRWTKPTVLLGSAGHLLAAPWQVFGGSG
jgi:hypothetical protein